MFLRQALMSGPSVDACCFAYGMDDHTLYTTERGMRALRHGANVVATLAARQPATQIASLKSQIQIAEIAQRLFRFKFDLKSQIAKSLDLNADRLIWIR